MLYLLLFPLKDDISFFRIFAYVTFRTVFAALTALLLMYLLGPRFINFLKKLKFKEEIRADGPQSHHSKAGTPTMGGLMIIVSMAVSTFLWGNFENHYVIAVTLGTILLAMVGFWDDYRKSILKIPEGMSPRVKLLLQFLVAGAFALIVFFFPYVTAEHPEMATELYIPFIKDPLLTLGYFAIPFWVTIIVGSSNAVNLTDGLDGLAIGISAIVLMTLAIIAYLTGILDISKYLLIPFVPEANELSVILAAMIGASVGFLWYNSHPAEVFMGDTGSLAIGGLIGMIAICIKRELLLVILGGVFVIEALSVIIQVAYFKMTGKRVFKMAPLHHHFELKGWHENKVVTRFWIVGALLALVALSSLKIL